MAFDYDMTVEKFYKINPSVGSDCSTLSCLTTAAGILLTSRASVWMTFTGGIQLLRGTVQASGRMCMSASRLRVTVLSESRTISVEMRDLNAGSVCLCVWRDFCR